MTPPDVPATLIGRILRALELMSSSPVSAAELARALDINRSTALRLLSELSATGYVARDRETKRFDLDRAQFLNLLIGDVPSEQDWMEDAERTLVSLRDATGDSTLLAVPAGDTMVYLSSFPSPQVLAVSEPPGTARPMHCSGVGKAYLSGLDDESLEARLGRLTYQGGTARAAGNARELRHRVGEARERGYALDLEETFDGVRCVAVPLRIGGTLVGAVGVTGPSTRFGAERIRELGDILRTAVEKLR